MNYRLIIDDNIKSLTALEEKVNNDASFIVFKYCFSFFIFTYKRLSPAILIDSKADFLQRKKKYNLLNYFFGWWAIPSGPSYTLQYIHLNNKGGINVTEDIMLNITEQDLLKKQVVLKKTNIIFDTPNNTDSKAFQKAFKDFKEDSTIKKIVVGLYLNTSHNNVPFYIIGIDAGIYFDKYIESLKKSLYKYFYKKVPFQFIDISNQESMFTNVELVQCIVKQGTTYINRQA